MHRGIFLIVIFFLTGAVLFIPLNPAQTTWYVDDNAPGDPGPGDPSISDPLEDGSASHPFDAIQEGINAASNGDTVLVADGTYTGTGNRDIDFLGKAITVKSENGPDNCIIDCQGSSSDEHRGFYFHSGEGLDSVLQGFTIRNGYVVDGGGIRCYNASPTITGNMISENNGGGGGGIDLRDSSARITDNNISGNQPTYSFLSSGGGINSNGGSPVILHNTISHNGTDLGQMFIRGGGIYCSFGTPIIANNTINFNISKDFGGGIYLNECSAMIMHNYISNNSVYDGGPGGGIFILFYEDEALPVTINNNIIRDNSSGSGGGGIHCVYGDFSLVIANNIISGSYGGCAGIYCNESSPTITNNLISDTQGPGIECESSSPEITNNTIVLNAIGCNPGGGIRCVASSFPTVLNSIIWGNEPDWSQICSSATVTYCDVEFGHPGTGNIDADPLFVRGPLGDYYLSQIAAGQSQDSPCVDAGDALIQWPCHFLSVCGTTRTDAELDTGIIDMGYHYSLVGIHIPAGHLLEEAPGSEPRIQGTE